jgi:3-oxoacyl-[acyl-carrier protein] reductase
MADLTGQVVLVTGAARGIGQAIARKLAEQGGHVVCADRDPVDETVAGIRDELGGAAEALLLDVTDAGAAAEAVAGIKANHDRLDVLVNNAGITRDQLLIRMKPEDWDLVMAINLKGMFNLSQPVAKLMMRQRAGRIINISSVVGMMGNAGQTNYSASKAGVIGFTKSLARELGSRGITVNAIAPGYIRTPMTDKLTDAQREALIGNLAIQRLGEPEDVAAAVAFLAGPGASYITGTVLNISGGLYI